jgi:hypothetical protein
MQTSQSKEINLKDRRRIHLIGAGLLSVSSLAFGDAERGHTHQKEFIGVFYPVVTGIAFDPHRCPEPSHSILFSFSGSAQTTLGRAQFEQSHCEDLVHASFTRGLQTITFEDGWQLFGKYQGRLLPTPTTSADKLLIISGEYRNAGGTGPFETARGKGISAGTVDVTTGAATVMVSGQL